MDNRLTKDSERITKDGPLKMRTKTRLTWFLSEVVQYGYLWNFSRLQLQLIVYNAVFYGKQETLSRIAVLFHSILLVLLVYNTMAVLGRFDGVNMWTSFKFNHFASLQITML